MMTPDDILGAYRSAVHEARNFPPTVTAADHAAAAKLAGITDGHGVLAVIFQWPRFCLHLVDRMMVTFPPPEPSLSFVVEHYMQAQDFIRAEGLADFDPLRHRAPGAIDGDGRSLTAVAV